jgi:hypothetical protein
MKLIWHLMFKKVGFRCENNVRFGESGVGGVEGSAKERRSDLGGVSVSDFGGRVEGEKKESRA